MMNPESAKSKGDGKKSRKMSKHAATCFMTFDDDLGRFISMERDGNCHKMSQCCSQATSAMRTKLASFQMQIESQPPLKKFTMQ